MHLTAEQKKALHPINIIVFFLSVYVIIALIIDTFFPLSKEVRTLLHEIDYVICLIFFIDFFFQQWFFIVVSYNYFVYIGCFAVYTC